MSDLLNFIRPPEDADWKTLNRWRWNVCLSLLVLFIFAGLAMSPWGFLRAEEAERRAASLSVTVDQKIAGLQTEQKKQGAAIDRVSQLLIEQLATAKAAQIRLVISKRCKTTGFVERDELQREIERLQEEYMSLKSVKYDAPSCSEL